MMMNLGRAKPHLRWARGHCWGAVCSKCLTPAQLPQGRLAPHISTEGNGEGDHLRGNQKAKQMDFHPALYLWNQAGPPFDYQNMCLEGIM